MIASYDFAIQFDRHSVRLGSQQFDERGDGRANRHLARVPIDLHRHR